jgi:hypothetical protein
VPRCLGASGCSASRRRRSICLMGLPVLSIALAAYVLPHQMTAPQQRLQSLRGGASFHACTSESMLSDTAGAAGSVTLPDCTGAVVPSTHPGANIARKTERHDGTWLQVLRGGALTQRQKAGALLKQYGGAYLISSLCLSACSFALFYLLVSNGVDVVALMSRIGIKLGGNSERIGTVGFAYLLHKAASPIRFPPTVALTAVVAKRLEGWRHGADTSAPPQCPSA